MDLRTFRQSYPQYDGLNDQDLADKLYARHYSKMPRQDFDAQVGLNSATSEVGSIGPYQPKQQFPNVSNLGGDLLSKAQSQYPYMKNANLAATYTEGNKDNRQLEYWPAGESGDDQYPRPKNIPLESSGVEVFNKDTRPLDVLADYVSHEAVNKDPKLKALYDDFSSSVPDAQMRERYEYHKQNLGEKRPYEEWKTQTGMPEFFRGYTFDQWKDSEKLYTPQQLEKLKKIKDYLGIGEAGQKAMAPQANLAAAPRNPVERTARAMQEVADTDDFDPYSQMMPNIPKATPKVQKAAGMAGRAAASGLPAFTEGGYGVLEAAAGALSNYVGQPLADWEVLPVDPFADMTKFFSDTRKGQGELKKIVAGPQEGATELQKGILSGIQSLGNNAAPLIAGMMTGNPGFSLGPMTASVGGQSFGEAADAGLPFDKAATYGTGQGLIEYVTEKIPVTWFLKDLKANASFAKMLAHNLVSDIPGEQVATILQDLNQWATLNPDKPFSEYLAERPDAAYQTLVATLTQAGIQTTVTHAITARPNASPKQRRARAGDVTEEQLKGAAIKPQSLLTGTVNPPKDFVVDSEGTARRPDEVVPPLKELPAPQMSGEFEAGPEGTKQLTEAEAEARQKSAGEYQAEQEDLGLAPMRVPSTGSAAWQKKTEANLKAEERRGKAPLPAERRAAVAQLKQKSGSPVVALKPVVTAQKDTEALPGETDLRGAGGPAQLINDELETIPSSGSKPAGRRAQLAPVQTPVKPVEKPDVAKDETVLQQDQRLADGLESTLSETIQEMEKAQLNPADRMKVRRDLTKLRPILQEVQAQRKAAGDAGLTREQILDFHNRMADVTGHRAAPIELTGGKTSRPVTEAKIHGQPVKVATAPTEAQKAAGNYQKGNLNFQGMNIAVENLKGSIREGRDAKGKKWKRVMNANYGYIKKTEGADGDQVDVFLGKDKDAPEVYVVDQLRPDGQTFDEHKTLVGYKSQQEAEEAYLSHYPKGWKGMGAVTAMPVSEFKEWIKSGDTTKPMSWGKEAPAKETAAPAADVSGSWAHSKHADIKASVTKIDKGYRVEFENNDVEEVTGKTADSKVAALMKKEGFEKSGEVNSPLFHKKREDIEYHATQIEKYAEASGWSVDETFGSGLSGSKYVVLSRESGDEVETVKIRVSNHELPPTYKYQHGMADYEVVPDKVNHNDAQGDWRDAIKWLSQKSGSKIPAAVRSADTAKKNKYQSRIDALIEQTGAIDKFNNLKDGIDNFDPSEIKISQSRGGKGPTIFAEYRGLIEHSQKRVDESSVDEARKRAIADMTKRVDELRKYPQRIYSAVSIIAVRDNSLAERIDELMKKEGFSKSDEVNDRPLLHRNKDQSDSTLFVSDSAARSPAARRLKSGKKTIYLKKVDSLRTGVDEVNSKEDVADVMKDIGNEAQENLMFLAVDANSKPIGAVLSSIGTENMALLAPNTIGAVLSLPGVKKIHMAHNHPSGRVKLSDVDLNMAAKLRYLLRDSGVEMGISVVVGPNGNQFGFDNSSEDTGIADHQDKGKSKKVSVFRRRLRGEQPSAGAVRSPNDLHAIIPKNKSGVLFLNNHNVPIGFTDMTPEDMAKLRTNDPESGTAKLLRRAHDLNAVNVVVVASGNTIDNHAAAKNVSSMFGKTGIDVLDVYVGGESYAEKGLYKKNDVFFHKNKETRAVENSEEFKRWFGDSKVVDSEGKPLVVFHGTNEDIDRYRIDDDGAIWFTSSPETAEGYGKVIYPNYLKISNPFEFKMTAEPVKMSNGKWALRIYNSVYGSSLSEEEFDKKDAAINEIAEINPTRKLIDAAVSLARKNGHDGVIFRGIDDTVGIHRERSDVYVAFNASQAKSSVGNRGMYDPKNPDIRAHKGQGRKGKQFIDDVRERVEAVFDKMAVKPDVVVVGSLDELPDQARAIIEREGDMDSIDAFYMPSEDTIYFLAENFDSLDDVEGIALHEGVVHFGIRWMIPAETYSQITDGIAEDMKEQVEKKCEEYGLDFSNEHQRRIAAEEVIAEMAETYLKGDTLSDKAKRWLDNLIQALRDSLAKLGFTNKKYDERFIASLLNALHEHVSTGAARRMDVLLRNEALLSRKPKFHKRPGKLEIEAGGGEYAIGVENLSPEEVQVMESVMKDYEAPIAEQRRGTRPWSATEKAALKMLENQFGMTLDHLVNRKIGSTGNAEQLEAYGAMVAGATRALGKLANRAAQTQSNEDLANLAQARERLGLMLAPAMGYRTEAGRSLNILKKTAQDFQEANKLWEAMGDGSKEAIQDFADRVRQVGQVDQIIGLVRASYTPTWWDKFYEYWINGILSGVKTHAVNIVSNGFMQGMEFGSHALAAATSKHVSMREVRARAAAISHGATLGLAHAIKAFQTEDPQGDAATKFEVGHRKAIKGRLGRIVRIPGRALLAEDEFFKSVAYHQELAGLAMREALTTSPKDPKAAFDEIMGNILNRQDLIESARAQAKANTFQTPMGPITSAVARALDKTKVGRLIVPFIRTPTNIIKTVAAYSPAAPIVQHVREQLAEGGADAAVARARMMIGSGIALSALALAIEGLLSGHGPDDEREKKILMRTGWKPYSVKVNGTWYQYSRFDPMGSTLGLMADLYETSRYLTEDEIGKAGSMLMTSIAMNLGNKTYLRGITDFAQAYADPDRYLSRWANNMAASVLVPNIVAQSAREMDPLMRDSRTFLDTLRERIPGLRSQLPVKTDLAGEAITSGNFGWFVPLTASDQRKDSLAEALLKVGLLKDKPERRIRGVELSTDQYADFSTKTGTALWKQLTPYVETRAFQQMIESDPEQARANLERRWNHITELTRKRWLADHPDIRREVIEQKKKPKAIGSHYISNNVNVMERVRPLIEGKRRPEAVRALRQAGMPALADLMASLPRVQSPAVTSAITQELSHGTA